MEENIQKKKKPIKLLIGIIFIVIIAVVVILILTSKEGKETVNLNATLEKIVEQNKLETVTFTYNVVGKECKESGCNKHSNNIDDYKYVVSCKGTVTSGIDFKKVKINLDEENKKLVVEIPEANILETNISSTNFLNGDKLPADEIVSARALCKKEILQKSAADMELKKAAKEQVKIILSVYYEKWAKSLGDGYKVEVK
ncbi:MAG: DUF4230 domain-containing protein [Bacilli bacterium]|nr:DUF4230 domain-containing protein [Bacilli bacterium]